MSNGSIVNADNERLRDEVERLRGENKQLNERLRFDPRQAVSEWLSRFTAGVAAAAEEAIAVREKDAESAAGECTFWFVSASHIRSLEISRPPSRCLPFKSSSSSTTPLGAAC